GLREVKTAGLVKALIDTDSRNRTQEIRIGRHDSVTGAFTGGLYFDSGQYGYDGAGNISAIGSNAYSYDGAGRLIQAVDQYGSYRRQTYSYDDFGNMTRKAQYDSSGATIPLIDDN